MSPNMDSPMMRPLTEQDALATALTGTEWHKWKSEQVDDIHTHNLARAILAALKAAGWRLVPADLVPMGPEDINPDDWEQVDPSPAPSGLRDALTILLVDAERVPVPIGSEWMGDYRNLQRSLERARAALAAPATEPGLGLEQERLIADLTWALSRHENALLFGTLESPHEIAETLVADIVKARQAAAAQSPEPGGVS